MKFFVVALTLLVFSFSSLSSLSTSLYGADTPDHRVASATSPRCGPLLGNSSSAAATNSPNADVRLYTFLVVGLAVNAGISAVSAEAATRMLPDSHFGQLFIAAFVAQLSYLGANALSPFNEPVASKIRRLAFWATRPNAGLGGRPEASPFTLENEADAVGAAYTLRQQHATDRILTFRNALRWNADKIKQILFARESMGLSVALTPTQHALLARELTDALMLGVGHFHEIPPTHPTILGSFQFEIADRAFRDALVAQALERALAIAEQQQYFGIDRNQARAYIEEALDAWVPAVGLAVVGSTGIEPATPTVSR